MKATRRFQQGFTLIEVLVALVLLALVSLVSWQGLDAVQNVGERLDTRAEETLSLVRVLAQIERDVLLHAGHDVLSGPASAEPGAMPPGISWSAGTGLGLVRAVDDGTWQQLRWYLQDGSLFRAAGAPSYRLPLPEPHAGAAVLDDVLAFSVRVWRPGHGWGEPGAPGDAAEGHSAGPVHVGGIEVAIYRQGLGDDRPYRKVVVLP